MEGISERRPLGRETLFKQIGALAGAMMLWLLSLASLASSGRRPAIIAQGASLIVLVVVATVALPWSRLPEVSKVVPPIIALLVGVRIQVLLDAELWSASAYLLLPIFWLAAFATWTELSAGLLVVGAGLFGQALIWAHRGAGWRDTVVLAAATAVVGFAIHVLFQRVQARAGRHPALQAIDPLTGLPGRLGWEELVPQLLSQAAESRQPACVMVLHIDHLSAFVDRHSRKDADQLLRGAAAVWRDHLRKTDLMARIKGEEFAALFVGCSIEAAAGISRRVATLLDAPVTLSFGIAEWSGQESAAALSRRAEMALERAKRAGGGRVEFAATSSSRDDGKRLEWPASTGPTGTTSSSPTP